jgi:hypothetical protein
MAERINALTLAETNVKRRQAKRCPCSGGAPIAAAPLQNALRKPSALFSSPSISCRRQGARDKNAAAGPTHACS